MGFTDLDWRAIVAEEEVIVRSWPQSLASKLHAAYAMG